MFVQPRGNGDAVSSARTELSGLLAAVQVGPFFLSQPHLAFSKPGACKPKRRAHASFPWPQGSLADLRVEVAAAKRISNNATAAVAEMSPAPKSVRSSSAQPRAALHAHDLPDTTPISPPRRLAFAAPPPAPYAAMYTPVYSASTGACCCCFWGGSTIIRMHQHSPLHVCSPSTVHRGMLQIGFGQRLVTCCRQLPVQSACMFRVLCTCVA